MAHVAYVVLDMCGANVLGDRPFWGRGGVFCPQYVCGKGATIRCTVGDKSFGGVLKRALSLIS